MAATTDILQKLGNMTASDVADKASAPENENDELNHAPKPALTPEPEQQLTHQPGMRHTLEEILAQSNQPSPDFND